ncbi:hypothetical protein [Thauera sp. AutoDN2]|uniref:hypothetical protein n=1 Tax=Thauera sp. AutoDN2 TaxID=3416051 RepID=UPI003F4BCB0E
MAALQRLRARSAQCAVRSPQHEVLRPLESQAGTRNVSRGTATTAWWLNSRFQSFAFWRHP